MNTQQQQHQHKIPEVQLTVLSRSAHSHLNYELLTRLPGPPVTVSQLQKKMQRRKQLQKQWKLFTSMRSMTPLPAIFPQQGLLSGPRSGRSCRASLLIVL